MPRILHLLRHAQSAEKQQGQVDKDRDLTATGMREAASIGHYIKKNNLAIERIVSSAAIRAQSTSSVINGIIGTNAEIVIEDDLYEASVRNLMEYVNRLDDEYKNVLIVGHNPYLSYFAEYLTKAEIGSMFTAGLATLRFSVDRWSAIAEGSGSLENYVYPAIVD